MTRRIAAAMLAGAVAGACAGRGAGKEPEDEEVRAACEKGCGRVEACDPNNATGTTPWYTGFDDCVDRCMIAPYGEDNPARWGDACREEKLANTTCQGDLSCEDWLHARGFGDDPDGPDSAALKACLELALDEVVCRQSDDS